MDVNKLCEKYTFEELTAMADELFKKKMAGGGPSVKRRLENVQWAIAEKLKERRIARGETINTAGYTGRNSNRR